MRRLAVALLACLPLIAVVGLLHRPPAVAGPPSPATAASQSSRAAAASPPPAAVHSSTAAAPLPTGGSPTTADGLLPDGTTVSDEQYPGVSRLDPALLGALRDAATAAARAGITIHVTSGWRSPAYQDDLLHQAVTTYGSLAAAARWVATADTSAHVAGRAVDLGPSAATAWLSTHGARYGLCQVYRNEPWHYELRPGAVDHGCPAMYADPTQDPRMQS